MAISAIIVLIGFVAGTSNNSTAQANEMETVVSVGEQLADTIVSQESIAKADTLVQQAVVQKPAMQRRDYSGLLDALNNSIDKSISFKDIIRGIFGLIVIIGIAWLFSNNRKAINWKFVAFSLLFQIAIALCIIYIPAVAGFFTFFGKIFVRITMAAEDGVIFISIDDNEVTNLSKICDEIFGSDNAIAVFPRLATKSGKTPLTFILNPGEYGLKT